ncbi:DNA-processing protein DprA [Vreelandella populi]|uniref:DNA-protecting protein DprA n=1 Tax=Vreelandella populi TaxID=2498858 RepID=A0A3S0X1U8_9GAMM|nr:DNA-processing protein DprA [Halomonas populi]RUR39483.1 DNA-protecting protein DprA [Halomonas populi]RUR46597.1 DNA-protecting protein DprA [Halomonas populi]RUR52902.1 DNA-protecting protein DprA [Halomonas populi]
METREWLAVNALPGMGALRIHQLVARRPRWPEGWLAALPSNAASALRLWLEHPERSPLQQQVEASLTWQQSSPGRHILHRHHPAWPALLDEIDDPPAVLWAQGDLSALEGPKLAMVGTRKPTSEGSANAQGFARELARRGWCVVSGMALGVDGIAQRAALSAGGSSIAVLGCGVDVIYPARHRDLHEQLGQAPGGLLLSEHPPGTVARPAFFPRRNRIVTGLSLGTLVVEATEKSGSLVSARLALEQGKELFALPGSLHNVQAQGCLHLLRNGATLVRHVDDMLEELQQWASTFLPPPTVEPQVPVAEADECETLPDTLLRDLSATPTPLDVLVQATGESVSGCQQRLLMLELDGWVAQQAGGWVRLPRP